MQKYEPILWKTLYFPYNSIGVEHATMDYLKRSASQLEDPNNQSSIN